MSLWIVEGIIKDYQGVYRPNRSTTVTVQIFVIMHTSKNMEVQLIYT